MINIQCMNHYSLGKVVVDWKKKESELKGKIKELEDTKQQLTNQVASLQTALQTRDDRVKALEDQLSNVQDRVSKFCFFVNPCTLKVT